MEVRICLDNWLHSRLNVSRAFFPVLSFKYPFLRQIRINEGIMYELYTAVSFDTAFDITLEHDREKQCTV